MQSTQISSYYFSPKNFLNAPLNLYFPKSSCGPENVNFKWPRTWHYPHLFQAISISCLSFSLLKSQNGHSYLLSAHKLLSTDLMFALTWICQCCNRFQFLDSPIKVHTTLVSNTICRKAVLYKKTVDVHITYQQTHLPPAFNVHLPVMHAI